MKNKFQSKSVPRGTRTIWRYLGALFILFTFAIGNVWAYTYNHATSVPEWTVNFNAWSGESDASGATAETVHNPRLYWNGSSYKNNLGTAQDIAFDGGGFYYIYQPNNARHLPTGDALSALCYVVAKAQTDYLKYGATGTTISSPATAINGLVSNSSTTNNLAIEFHLPRAGYVRLMMGTDSNGDPTGTANDSWKNITLSGATEGDVAVTYHASGATYDVKTKTGATTFSTTTYTSAGKKMRSVEFAVNSGTTTMTVNPAKLSNNSGTARKLYIYAVEVYMESAATYTIQYNSNGGSGTMSNSTNTVSACTFTAPSATKVFDHWNDKADDSGANYAVGASVGKDITLYAQWADKFTVTYDKNGGTGTMANTTNEIVACTFTAPSGKGFKEWNTQADGKGTKYEVGATVTSNLDLYAIWKALPQTIYYWQSSYSGNPTMNSAVNVTGGTIEWKTDDNSKSWAYESYNNGSNVVPADLQVASGKKAVKSGGNALYAELTLAGTATFQEGDTIYVGGYKKWMFSTTKQRYDGTSPSDDPTKPMSGDIALVTTGSSNSSYDDGYAVIPAGVNVSTMYLIRGEGASSSIAAIKVVRPAQKDVKSTTYDLTAVKINGTAISAADLATLKTGEAYLLDLTSEYPVGPTVKFARKTTITYEDDSQKVTNDTITVTATEVSSKWQAQATIGTITYTVKMAQVTAATVSYYDGTKKLGEEVVAINGHPAEYADYQSKDLSSFVGWYDNSGLTGDAVTIASATITKDTTFYGKWNPVYAQSANLEQWVLDYGKTYDAWAQLGALGYSGSFTNSLDSLDDNPSKTNRNYAYLGFKVKNESGKQINFRVANGNTVKIKFGNVGATPKVQYNNTGDYADMTITEGVYTYAADGADAYISIKAADNSTLIFKQIMIDEPIADVVLPAIVTLDANGGTYADASVKYTGTALVIGDATPADEDHVFVGWYDGDDQIDATAYVPTKNVTLQAHYANKLYTVTYVGGEGATGSMDPVQVAWGDDYTALACGFAKENHSFVKWTVAGVDAISEIAAGSAFVMPKGNVTLTAQWANDLLVARIGDDYYESLPLAVAAAIASEETSIDIQLLAKDGGVIEGSGVKIPTANKTITIDFNGMKYIAGDPAVGSTGTETQAFQLLKDNNITLKNGAIACKAGSNVKMLIQNYSNLTLKNIRLEGENLNIAASSAYTLSNNNGAVVIGNGTEVIAKEGGVAFDVCYYASYPSVSVTVLPGASIDGKIEMSMSNNKQGVEENCQLIITGGEFENFSIDHTNIPEAGVNAAISAGTFDAPVENLYCAENYVPATISAGVYSVEPKTGVEIIGVVTTGGTNKTVTGLYKGDASVNLDDNQKIGSGKYIYVTLASGYTFEETDVLVVDLKAKSDLSGGTKALEITTGVGNIDGSVWKSIAYEDYTVGENTISLEGIAEGQTSIGLKRSANQNAWVNGLKVYRPMMPEMTAITINGEDAVKGTGNTFTITLPEEGTDLAALTVVPTIIRNAPHATTPEAVISNEGAWKEGANTYRVMDKDGDYTDYTITITLQGQAQAPVITTQPAGVAYCAGSEPTLTVEATGNELHYAWFKEAGETDEAVGTDEASYTIASAGTYYVIVTNHVDGKLDASVTSANAVVTLNVAAAITTQPTNKRDVVAGSEVTLSVVATNATGYQWYSCDDAEKHGAAAISGAEAANYVFTCNANGFYYCVVGNACGDDITSNVVSVKLEPEGCNTFASKPAAEPYNYEQTGEWTFYYVDSNGADKSTDNVFKDGKNFDDEDVIVADTRRFALKFEKDVESVILYGVGGSDKSFTKVSVSDEMKKNTYTELTATATKTDLTSQQHIYTIEDMIIPAGKYAWFELSGSLKFFKICYSEALAMPKLPTLVNQELCAGAAYEEFDATITNAAACEGTVAYKWYETTDTENPVATTAKFTPSAEGTYYVVVTHSAAGHITRTVQSDELSVAHFDALSLVSNSGDVFQHMGTEATLSVVATGKNVAYAWYTCDVDGNNADVISGASTASYVIASIAEGVQYYKIVLSHDCDATTLSHIFKVEGWNQLEQVDVTASTVWDMNNVSASEINLASFEPTKQNVRLLLANIEGVNNNASFNSQALMFEGQRIGRTENNVKYVSGQYVQFNVTVPGMVSVTFASNGDAQRTIQINGKECSRTTTSSGYIRYDVAVEPGSVEIEDVQGYVRISKIEFKAEDNYHRTVNPSYLGTLCWTNNAVLGGATLYAFAGKNENNYLVFDEVAENRLEAGKPYIFMPENGNTEIKVYNTDSEEPLTEDQAPVNNMYGTITGKTLVPGVDDNMYYFSASHIWAVKDFTVNISIPAFCCYVDYEAVLNDNPAPAPAPGRRRVAMGVQGTQVATGCENLNVSDKPVKMIINGQLFILRGEKMYDAKGQLVK